MSFFKYILIIFISILFYNCSSSENSTGIDSAEEIRNFVIEISTYSKSLNNNFIIIPQNSIELLSDNLEPSGNLVTAYLNAIDGVAQEHPFYGADGLDIPTPDDAKNEYIAMMNIAKNNGLKVLSIDYAASTTNVNNSYSYNNTNGYISFCAPSYNLNSIPADPAVPYNENSTNITTINESKNFLYIIDSTGGAYSAKSDFLNAINNTNFDILIIDPFYEDTQLTSSELDSLKTKKDGGTRLVIAYINIGAAENWRYYWQPGWQLGNPSWIAKPYEGWAGEYFVHFWNDEWKNIIYGNNNSYIKKILDANFDGVYLDNLTAYEKF